MADRELKNSFNLYISSLATIIVSLNIGGEANFIGHTPFILDELKMNFILFFLGLVSFGTTTWTYFAIRNKFG